MSWLGEGSLDEVLGGHPAVGPSVQQLRSLAAATTPGRSGELITARLAQLVLGADADPSLVPATEAEHAVVAVAEQFVLDAHGIDDAMMARLGTWYTTTEVVAIMFHLALVDGFTKFRRVMGDDR